MLKGVKSYRYDAITDRIAPLRLLRIQLPSQGSLFRVCHVVVGAIHESPVTHRD